MEEFKFSCPHCQQTLAVPDELMGQVIECPSCKGRIELPPSPAASAATATPPAVPPSAQAPGKKQFVVKNRQFTTPRGKPVETPSAAPAAAPVENSAVPEATSPEAQLAAKERKRKGNLWGGAGLGLLFGLLLMGVGKQNSNLRNVTAGEPKRMTLAQLVQQGPGENRYVELTNLLYGEHAWVEEKSGSWQGAWTFLFTEDDPQKPVAAAYLKDGGEKMITAAMSQNRLRGLVETNKKFFDSYTGRQLYKMYPHVKTRDTEYFVRVITWRPSQRGIAITYGCGIGLILLGLILAAIARMSGKASRARQFGLTNQPTQ